MKVSIYFPAFAFLVLFALLLLFSDQFSRSSVPHSMLKSEKAIDGTALEKATSIDQEPATNRNAQPDPGFQSTEFRGRFSDVEVFPSPARIRLLSTDLTAEASVDIKFKESTRKLHRMQTHVKNHAHSLIARKSIPRHRRPAPIRRGRVTAREKVIGSRGELVAGRLAQAAALAVANRHARRTQPDHAAS